MSGVSAGRDTAGPLRARLPVALCSLLWCAGGAACAPDTVTVRSHPGFAPRAITAVAVAPFRVFEGARGVAPTSTLTPPGPGDAGMRRSAGGPVPPAFRGARITSVSVPSFVPEVIRRMVYSRLARHFHVQVSLMDTVPPVSPDGGEETRGQHARPPELPSAADAILEGIVHVYREREGAAFAAIPAAVGFELRLLGAGDGGVLWVGEYFEEQKPLTQDVWGFFARSGTFVTAEELARDGVARMLQRLPLEKR